MRTNGIFQQNEDPACTEMMREENCNITEIAARLSYGSVQYFSRQFKKEMGMSPMEYLSSVKGITQALR